MLIRYFCDGEFQPVVASSEAAGIDLYNNGEDVIIKFGQSCPVKTATYFEIPIGYVGLVFIRGGHGTKGLQLNNCVGVIDSDYRGEIGTNLIINKTQYMVENGIEEITVKRGERFCQMVVVPHAQYELMEVNSLEEFTRTERGTGRYNSTGKY